MLVTNPTACRALPNKPSLPQAVPLLVTGRPVRLPGASSLDILSLGVCPPVITYRFSRTAGDTMTRWVEGRMAREGPFPAGGHACANQCMTLCLCHSRKPECEHTRATAQHTGQQPSLCPTALANALRGGQQGARTFGRTLPERLWPCAEGPSAAEAGSAGRPRAGRREDRVLLQGPVHAARLRPQAHEHRHTAFTSSSLPSRNSVFLMLQQGVSSLCLLEILFFQSKTTSSRRSSYPPCIQTQKRAGTPGDRAPLGFVPRDPLGGPPDRKPGQRTCCLLGPVPDGCRGPAPFKRGMLRLCLTQLMKTSRESLPIPTRRPTPRVAAAVACSPPPPVPHGSAQGADVR